MNLFYNALRPSVHFYTHNWHYQVMRGLFRPASTSSNKLPSYYLALTAGNADISAAIHESCKKCLRLSCTIDSDCYWTQLELSKPLKKLFLLLLILGNAGARENSFTRKANACLQASWKGAKISAFSTIKPNNNKKVHLKKLKPT